MASTLDFSSSALIHIVSAQTGHLNGSVKGCGGSCVLLPGFAMF